MKPVISVVIPARNEEKSILPLYKELAPVLEKIGMNFEIIFIDDGSADKTFEITKNLHQRDERVKVIRLRGQFGKSIALQTGFDFSKGEVIITMDADLQDDPHEVPKLLKKLQEGYDLVSGWKRKRNDPPFKVVSSRIFNIITSFLTGVNIRDSNSGFKAYKKEVIESLNLYGELYRFIPILVSKNNYKVTEIEVNHRPRLHGKTKFGLERNVRGLLDLITITFLTGYISRPSHFFGSLGLLAFFIGFIIGIYITYLRITTGSIQFRHPLLFLGMLLMIIGVQLVSTGLLAEMFIRFNRKSSNNGNFIKELLF